MKKIKQRRYRAVCCVLAVLLLAAVCMEQKQVMAADSAEEVKNSVVEIQSGFIDGSGSFVKVKHGSGFIVSSENNGVYIVTTNKVVSNTEKSLKKYCEKHGISTENFTPSGLVRIVVKGDVAVDAQIRASSKEKDYALLSVQDAINERDALKLGDGGDAKEGSVVYALGFPENTENIEFVADDVAMVQGKVEENTGLNICHTAVIDGGNTGGPLIDAGGYVLGLDCLSLTDAENGVYGALSIDEIKEILDNFGISYESFEQDKKQITLLIYILGGFIVALGIIVVLLVIQQRRMYGRGKEHSEDACTGLYRQVHPADTFLHQTEDVPDDGEDKTVRASFNSGFLHRGTRLLLMREKDGKTYPVEKEYFIIGKKSDISDLVISDNPTVSRRHALIIWEEEQFYLYDTGSSNGTFLGERRVEDGEAIRLKNGDMVAFSDERFFVKIEGRA